MRNCSVKNPRKESPIEHILYTMKGAVSKPPLLC
jgi:hypothetical protein